MTVTKAQLDRWRAARAKARPGLEYRPGGTVQYQVDKEHKTTLEKQIAKGEEQLSTAKNNLEIQTAFASRKGLAKAHFNTRKQKQEITP